jgi:hypothetical protein
LKDEEIVRCLETIVKNAKMLVGVDDPAIDVCAKMMLATAQRALSYKSPDRFMEEMLEFE